MSGPRVYTLHEANGLIPDFERAFAKLDDIRSRLKSAKIKLTAIEMIWGQSVNDNDCPDHKEGVDLVRQLKKLEEEFNGVLAGLAELGAQVKDLEMGLLDVYHVRDGRLVHLCWKRDEKEIVAWHHVDEGFANRQEL